MNEQQTPMDAQIQELCNKVVESWLRQRQASPSGLEQYLHDTLDAVLDDMIAGCATQHVDAAVRAYCEAGVAERAATTAGVDATLDTAIQDWRAGNLDALVGEMAARQAERLLADTVEKSVKAALARNDTALISRASTAAVAKWLAEGEVPLPSVTPDVRARISETLNGRFKLVTIAEKAANEMLAEAWKISQGGHGTEVVAAALGVSTAHAKRLVVRASDRISELRAQLAMFKVERGLDEIRDDGNAH